MASADMCQSRYEEESAVNQEVSSVQAERRCKKTTVQWHYSEITSRERPNDIKIIST
jgi:hypothetical protein